MAKPELISAAHLRKIVPYDPPTGIFTWLVRKARRTHVGDIAGTLRSDGYVVFKIDSRMYKSSRLAWLWMTGEWPNRPYQPEQGR